MSAFDDMSGSGHPDFARYSYNGVTAWAVLGGKTIDIAGWQVNFELNTIPTATFRFPLGRNMATDQPSPIHAMLDNLEDQTAIELWLDMSQRTASDPGIRDLGIPAKPFRLFTGVTVGTGYVKNNQGAAQLVLNCQHILGLLDQGSVLSAMNHPGNPGYLTFGAIVRSAQDKGVLNNWTAVTSAGGLVEASTIAEDLWGKALYPWLTKLADQDGIWIVEQGLRGSAGNAAVKNALALLKPGTRDYVPLAPKSTFALDVDIAAAIRDTVGLISSDPETAAHQTFWDMLVGRLCPEFLMAVVPRTADALIVPYVACLDAPPDKIRTLRASEYVGVQVNGDTPRPLRAIGILSSIGTRAGSVLTGSGPSDRIMGIGGWYDTKRDGTVVVEQGPSWMSTILTPALYSASASGGDLKPTGSELFPGAGAATNAAAQAKTRGEKVIKPLLNAYAKAVFARTVLAGRYGLFAGPFRLDIAPGSIVAMEGTGEPFIADDGTGSDLYGTVLRVSLQGDADNGSFGAAFHVAYTRSAAQAARRTITVAEHPIYANAFYGTGLLSP